MPMDKAIEAVEVGIAFVEEKVKEGFNTFLVGEMGIGNTTSSAVITAKFSGLSADEATGRRHEYFRTKRLKVKQKSRLRCTSKICRYSTYRWIGCFICRRGLGVCLPSRCYPRSGGKPCVGGHRWIQHHSLRPSLRML